LYQVSKSESTSKLETPKIQGAVRGGRKESFAVTSIPIPPGPPQLPPSAQRENIKRFATPGRNAWASLQPPPSTTRSALPRPASNVGSVLPVTEPRRSARGHRAPTESEVIANGATKNNTQSVVPTRDVVSVVENKLPEGHNAPVVKEKVVAPLATLINLPQND